MGIGEFGEQSGFSGVGVADEADVGHEFEFEAVVALFAGSSGGAFGRSLINGRFKVRVAESAASATGNDQLLAAFENLADEFIGVRVENNCSAGNNQDVVFAGASSTVATFAVSTVFSVLVRVVEEVVERVGVSIAAQNDTASVAAVAAVGAAMRREFFAPEGGDSVSAVSGFDEDFYAVFKYNHGGYLK